MLLPEVWQIVREPHPFPIKVWIRRPQCLKRSYQPRAIVNVLFTVQSQDLSESLAIIIQSLDMTVRRDAETVVERHVAGVWEAKGGFLCFIAGPTRVEQVRVFAFAI